MTYKHGIPLERAQSVFASKPEVTARTFTELCQTEDARRMFAASIALLGPETVMRSLSLPAILYGASLLNELSQWRTQHYPNETLYSAAEMVALVLLEQGITTIVAYPGTSELAVCRACVLAGIRVISGRGDSESVFIASGASTASNGTFACLVHGARGLTNAVGAIADVRRNEGALVCLVGLASTGSSLYMPPHHEPRLLETIGEFAKHHYLVERNFDEPSIAAAKLRLAVRNAERLPYGPIVIGLPQDVAESAWVPLEFLSSTPVDDDVAAIDINHDILSAVDTFLKQSKRAVVLVDDALYRKQGARKVLIQLAEALNAPVLQIWYRRGPMLFEQLTSQETSLFLGMYEPTAHREILKNTDLLITVEDRNAYPRVVGELPNCRKIAVTSNAEMTRKNGYLKNTDLLLVGEPTGLLGRLRDLAAKHAVRPQWWSRHGEEKEISSQKIVFRRTFGRAFAESVGKTASPVIIDDSQMFGALIAENYECLPIGLRVIGDHGGFVGGGLAYATGYALGNSAATVWCTLGDFAFLNGMKGLFPAVEHSLNLIVVVCNNGGSASLRKQLTHDSVDNDETWARKLLSNIPDLDYGELARVVGLSAFRLDAASEEFQPTLDAVVRARRPTFLEVICPENLEAWEGIWLTQGLENASIE